MPVWYQVYENLLIHIRENIKNLACIVRIETNYKLYIFVSVVALCAWTISEEAITFELYHYMFPAA